MLECPKRGFLVCPAPNYPAPIRREFSLNSCGTRR